MKQELDESNIQALVDYRLQRAYDTIREVRILSDEGCYNAAVNRLYYASYYAVTALLIHNHVETHTHNGVKQQFGLHFIATGKLPKQMSAIFSNLFEKRHSSDYDDFVYCDGETIEELLPKAQDFIDKIKNYLMSV